TGTPAGAPQLLRRVVETLAHAPESARLMVGLRHEHGHLVGVGDSGCCQAVCEGLAPASRSLTKDTGYAVSAIGNRTTGFSGQRLGETPCGAHLVNPLTRLGGDRIPRFGDTAPGVLDEL